MTAQQSTRIPNTGALVATQQPWLDATALAARAELRQVLKARRAALSESEQQAAATAVVTKLQALPEYQRAQVLGAYLSVRAELSTQSLLAQSLEQAKTVALPRLHPFTPGQLLFLRYQQDTDLTLNHYGIPEPVLAVPKVVPIDQLQLLLVPLLGFDVRGQRLGMGGGFYDRTLAAWAAGKLPQLLPVGLAHNCQRVERLPSAPWDVPLPVIITPDKVWDFRA